MTETERPFEGRIPFRIRIGVTGHRNLTTSGNLPELPAQIRKLLPETAATAVRLGVVSALAEGADRLVVDQVFEQASRLGEETDLPFRPSLDVRVDSSRSSVTSRADSTGLQARLCAPRFSPTATSHASPGRPG